MQTQERQKPERKSKRLIYVLIGIAVFVIVPAVFLTGLWISARQERASRPPEVVVPNVVGQEYRGGELLLKEKGLRMRVLAVRSDKNQPDGVIFDQNPPASESVVVNQEVTVMVGGGPGQPVPTPER